MELDTQLKVFVYGTLKPGEANYNRYCGSLVQSQTVAFTKGVLYDLPLGYPAMTEGNNQVKGVLLTFTNSQVLSSLDRLEDYNPQRDSELNHYYRRLVAVYNLEKRLIAQAWAYFMTPEQVKQYQGTIVSSNWWTSGIRNIEH